MYILKLSALALVPILVAMVVYIVDKDTKAKELPYMVKQIIIGVLFGLVACLASQFGVSTQGVIMNVRGASPLTAGLLFGGPAGLISGFIGALYRWISVYWGVGAYTRVACSLGTLLAGIFGAICRKFMFDNKKTSWLYGLILSMTTEVIHMLLVFVTHMNEMERAFEIVRTCAIPMILANGISVMLSILFVSKISEEKSKIKVNRSISQTFSVSLFTSILIAYLVTSRFTFVLQNSIGYSNVENLLSIAAKDIKADIDEQSDKNLLTITRKVTSEIEKSDILDSLEQSKEKTRTRIQDLTEKYDVSEINIVNKDGIIALSSKKEFDNFNFREKRNGQARDFINLLTGDEKEWVQPYGPIDYDASIKMKYAAVALTTGGFIQVGYDSEQFHKFIDDNIDNSARHRHIEKTGLVFILDENTNSIVSAPKEFIPDHVCGEILKNLDPQNDFTVMEVKNTNNDKYFFMQTHSEGYVIVSCIPQKEALFSRDVSVYIGVFMQIVVFTMLFILVYLLIKKKIVDNIHKINQSLSRITSGNLNTVVDVRTNEEFSSLSDDINTTVEKLKGYIAEAEERIAKELEFARTIQHSALPTLIPPYDNRSEFDIFAMMNTAKEVGGDFYDFYFVDDETLAFLIADVSGKGIPAAMFMMTAKTIIKSLAESGLSVSETFTKANKKLCESNEAEMFVTSWMGFLNIKTGVVKFSNAGHNPPIIRHADGTCEYLKSKPGFVLAGMDGVQYKENEFKLEKGDRIFLYTDGVTEATDTNENLYGEDRLLEMLSSCGGKTAREICETVKRDVDDFVGEAPQFDDITTLSLEYKG